MNLKPYFQEQARHDFNKARWRESLNRILTLIRPARHELLSLQEIKDILKPKSETYKGMQTVPIDKIAGSEGRYRDFDKKYLPRYEYLRNRWMSVDLAHLQDVILPPIRLYEIGGLYFVRDGNHRVSVAKMKGIMEIDAEVVSLNSEIRLPRDVTRDTLKEKVIEWEQKVFNEKTGFTEHLPEARLEFTATGRYDEIIQHILVHKYYINADRKEELTFTEAMISWYKNVYKPIYDILRENRVLHRFPGRTEADLYVWISRHWDALKQKYGQSYSMDEAIKDFSLRYGKGIRAQLLDAVFRIYTWLSGKEKL